ncbi:tyrosine-protein phosphatase [Paramicrobacterium sp. CJ85]|uniref:tyrosine-protein phosphatase n=1 Tax=Paramicrobacterium sp. CJ85 TaxID=3445355 RepID=UPI003F5F24AB
MSERTSAIPEGLVNFRDLGGLPAEGGRVRTGRLYRSDALVALSPDGIRQLKDSPITTIIDLRSRTEVEQTQPMLDESTLGEYLSLPLMEGAVEDVTTRVPTLTELYTGLVDTAGDSFARIAEWVAVRSRGGVLVHCTAGKDRTGVAVALLLDAVGVPRQTIIEDYVASAQNLAGPWAERMLGLARQMGVELTPQVRMLVTGTEPDAMQRTLEHVDAEHGGSVEYLTAHGLDADARQALRNALVQPE